MLSLVQCCCSSVVLWLDEGDFPEDLHFAYLCHNKNAFLYVCFLTLLCLDVVVIAFARGSSIY